MIRTQIADKHLFLTRAKEKDCVISVIRSTKVVPRVLTPQKVVVMAPAVEIHYTITFGEGDERESWIYSEMKYEEDGRLDLSGTLWEELERKKKSEEAKGNNDRSPDSPRFVLVHRSGSF